MGFFRFVKGTLKVTQAVVTLGASVRIADAQKDIEKERTIYQDLSFGISRANERIQDCIARIRVEVSRTKRDLNSASYILYPKCMRRLSAGEHIHSPSGAMQRVPKSIAIHQSSVSDLTAAKYALAGTGLGAASVFAAWNAVQVIGVASTGTSVGSLYGAAATNAGLAWFGGGSLAAGGGGMAAGALVLPGIGIAVGVAASSILGHKKANELNRICEEIRAANEKNRALLAQLKINEDTLDGVESSFAREHERLAEKVRDAKRLLFRFGWLSYLRKRIRLILKGVFYTTAEMRIVDSLEEDVSEFQGKVLKIGVIRWGTDSSNATSSSQ